MNKKLLALALAGTFAFAGCGNNAENTEEVDTNETTVEEPAVEDATTEVEEDAEDTATEVEEDAADDAATEAEEVEEDATEEAGN